MELLARQNQTVFTMNGLPAILPQIFIVSFSELSVGRIHCVIISGVADFNSSLFRIFKSREFYIGIVEQAESFVGHSKRRFGISQQFLFFFCESMLPGPGNVG